MSESEAEREEAYLNKMLNRGARNSNVKKTVFGGGLEAARAKVGGAPAPAPAPAKPAVKGPPVLSGGLEAARLQAGIKTHTPAYSTPAPAPAPTPVYTHTPQPTAWVPPPLETEVIELSLPPPPHSNATFTPPPLECEEVSLDLPPPSAAHINDKGLRDDDDEAARREAERMAKQVGRFHLGPRTTTPTAVGLKTGATGPSTVQVSGTQGRGSTRQRKDWEQSPLQPQYNTKFENFLLAEIVLARNSPDLILDRLRERRSHYRGNDYIQPDFGTVMATQEGLAGLNDAIRYLEKLQPLKTKLKLEEGLSLSARDFCELARNTTQPDESQSQAENRLTRYGNYAGALSQNVVFSNVPPSDLILDWIIDDGQGPSGRPHRHAIFDTAMSTVGIASGPHAVGRVICVLFASEYSPIGNEELEVTLPPPGAVYVPLPKEGFVYPDFKVGSLYPEGNASVLPISSLSCDVSELYLGIRQNGKSLEFRRTVTENGRPRKQIQTFTLPYPVNAKTVSSVYYPNKNLGEIMIRLGKQLANEGGALTLEFELAQFTVLGDPYSSSTRVQIGVDQKEDHFIFRPGPSSRYTTEFVVVLNGNTLEFKSTYSFEEDGSVKTVHGKQSVQLPTPPTLDQIDVSGSTLTVWPNRQKGKSQELVPDSDVFIEVR